MPVPTRHTCVVVPDRVAQVGHRTTCRMEFPGVVMAVARQGEAEAVVEEVGLEDSKELAAGAAPTARSCTWLGERCSGRLRGWPISPRGKRRPRP
jgi:hypothetical protein